MGLSTPVGFLYWYTTSIILGLLTLLNIFTHLIRFRYRNRSPAPSPEKSSANPDSPPSVSSADLKDVEAAKGKGGIYGQLSLVRRAGRAAATGWNKYAILNAFRIPTINRRGKRVSKAFMPTTQFVWTVGYLIGNLVLSFYGTAWDITAYSNQAGWLCCAQIPLIIALAGKNNLISFLTGIGYEKLAFLHIAAGRVCFLGMWIHAGGYFYMMKGFHANNWATQLSRWGFTGLLAFTLLTGTSIRWVRKKLYEFFLVVHLCLVALTLAAFIMHWRAVDVWIYPGIGLWAADRLFRLLRIFFLNKLWLALPSAKTPSIPSNATLKLLTPSTLMISFQNPSSYLQWTAGQHFYVILPGLSRLPWEAHPFTATTIPGEADMGLGVGELTFIVRVRDGATKRMKDAVDKERKAQGLGIDEECSIVVPGAVEGPYGEMRRMDMYDGVIIVAGGSGISFAVAHMLQAIRDAKEGKRHPKEVKIIWMVKSRLHLNWVSPILFAHAHSIPQTLRVSLHIHVTRHYIPRASISLPPQAELPADPNTADNTWSTYLAERAAEPARRKSTMSWVTFGSDPDSDGRTGPGTRRGSTYVLNSETAKLAPAKQLPASPEEQRRSFEQAQEARKAMANFKWSEGYNHDDSGSPKHTDGPTKKRSSESPSFEAVDEEKELQIRPQPQPKADGLIVSYGRSAPPPSEESMSPPDSPLARFANRDVPDNASWKISPPTSPTQSQRPLPADLASLPPSPIISIRRASLAPSAGSLRSSRRGSILMDAALGHDPLSGTGSAPASPSMKSMKKRLSVSFDEPVKEGRRKASVQSLASSSILGSRRGSALTPTLPLYAPSPRRPSGLLNVIVPVEGDSPTEEREDGMEEAIQDAEAGIDTSAGPRDPRTLSTPMAGFSSRTRPPLTPLYIGPHTRAMSPPARSPSPFSANVGGSSFGTQPNTSLLMAPVMIKSSSATSGLSVRSADSNEPSPIPFLQRPKFLESPSGIRTPTLTLLRNQEALESGQADLDLSEPADLNNPEALLEEAFKATKRERESLSEGMETLVHWHEGRADVHAVVTEMMIAMGAGGTVDVEACGPISLLEKCKEVVKDLGDVQNVWRGGARVVYHAETFGW